MCYSNWLSFFVLFFLSSTFRVERKSKTENSSKKKFLCLHSKDMQIFHSHILKHLFVDWVHGLLDHVDQVKQIANMNISTMRRNYRSVEEVQWIHIPQQVCRGIRRRQPSQVYQSVEWHRLETMHSMDVQDLQAQQSQILWKRLGIMYFKDVRRWHRSR